MSHRARTLVGQRWKDPTRHGQEEVAGVTGTVREDAASGSVELERYRVELTGYCYRLLGSAFEAEDAVQETMTRAWRGLDRFEGRSALRSWLYRIATNVCFSMLSASQRRARPMDLTGPSVAGDPLGPPLAENVWVTPVADDRVLNPDGDPADLAVARESVRLAFVAALQHLPPRQRAVLILCEVLRWKASEAAELLETTVASVNSALQRARATLAELNPDTAGGDAGDNGQLVERYVDAFERFDMDSLVALLHEDVTLTMPPHAFWVHGAENAHRWWLSPGPAACRDGRLIPVAANGTAAFGAYRLAPDGGHNAFSIQVLDIRDGRIAAIDYFLDTATMFPLFGLPERLPPASAERAAVTS
jgi:RNA polymerase sigma-70 factor, ECF subfamily